MPRNIREYKVFGMRRSGNHAVLHWMAEHFDKPCWFANDVPYFGEPAVRKHDDIGAGKLGCFKVPVGVEDFWEHPKEVLMHSYEDYDISDLDLWANIHMAGSSEIERSVLIIRNPYNLMASRAARKKYHLLPVSRMVTERWKQHAKEALGETDYLKDKVVVYYDRWVSEEPYRRELEKQLALPEIDPIQADATMNRVVMAGSSFSNRDKDGDAGSMKIDTRWKAFTEVPWFLSLFDKRTVEIAERMGMPWPFGRSR